MSQGAFTQGVWGIEEVSGVATPGQKAGTMYGIRTKNFQFTPKPKFERTENIDPSGMLQPGRVGAWDLPFSFESDMSVDDAVRLRAHMQGYAAITTVAAGVQSWAIRELRAADSLATALDWISFEGDRDDLYATLLLNGAIDQWDMQVRTGKIIGNKVNGMACRFTHMRDPQAVVGPASYTGTVYVRNNRFDADAIDTTQDIKFKVTTAGALDGTGKIRFTKGVVAYGSVEYPVVADVWMPVIYGDGTYAGSELDPVEVKFTLGTGSLTAGGTPDEWKIEPKRPKATATYPARNSLMAVRTVFLLGGTEYVIEDSDISFKRPRKYRRGSASKYPIGLLPDGRRTFSIKLKRDYTDRNLYLKLLSSSNLSFDMTINGDFIATVSSVSYFEKWNMHSNNAQVLEAGADIPNEKQLPESITIVPSGQTGATDLSEVIQGTLATLK